MVLYELAVLGDPTDEQLDEIEKLVSQGVEAFGLKLGNEVGWSIKQMDFKPLGQQASAAIFFGGTAAIVFLGLCLRCVRINARGGRHVQAFFSLDDVVDS